MNVLLIDDDRELVDMLVFAFRRAGLATTTAHDVESGLARFEADKPDLVVLDLHLGGSDGFDFLQRVRRTSQTPIIILTALSSEDDKVKGLSMGADDYVTKPFSHRELLTRILMRLRRSGQTAPRPMPNVLRVSDIELDANAHTVQRSGKPVNLTVTEFRLLHHLLVNAGQVVKTEDILRHVWGNPDPTDSDVLRVTLHRLRRKLGENGTGPGLLRTVPGVGVLLHGERIVVDEPAPIEEPPAPLAPTSQIAPAATAQPAQISSSAPTIPAPIATVPPPAPALSFRQPVAAAELTGGRVEREGTDRIRLRFRPDAEVESILFSTSAATLESYDSETEEVTWTMPARGERAWDVFEVARRRGFTFSGDIDVPMPATPQAQSTIASPPATEVAAPATPVAISSAPTVVAEPVAAPAEAAPSVAARVAPLATIARASAKRATERFRGAVTPSARATAEAPAAPAARPAVPTQQRPAAPTAPAAAPKAKKSEPAEPRASVTARLSDLGNRMSTSSRTAAMLLAITMLAAVLSIWSETRRLALLGELERVGEISAAAFNQSEARQLLLAITLLAFYVMSGIAFLSWLNRSYARLQARKIQGLRFGPFTAIIWFFIPIGFLFMPRRVVNHLWHANALPVEGKMPRRTPVPMLISVWWTVFVAFVVSAIMTGATTRNPDLTDLFRETWTNLASDILAFIGAALAIVVIGTIEARRPDEATEAAEKAKPQRSRR